MPESKDETVAEKDLRLQLMELKAQHEKTLAQCRFWQNKCQSMANQQKSEQLLLKNQYKDMLSKVFTPGQIRLLFNPGKKIKWSPDDISSAISLKCVSSKAYRYLRNVVKLPLPAVSTLRRWMSNLEFSPGILTNVLNIMKNSANSYSEIDRLTVLSFDEIHLSKVAGIDRKDEQKIGPHDRCQVVFARGLFKSWKQPIYYDFDQAMTSEILIEIIKQLFEVSFTVVAFVCDLGPTNKQVFNSLDCDINDVDNYCFTHPCDENLLIHTFLDTPHLMKLLRNHFIDSGYKIDGCFIDKSIIEELLKINEAELNLVHKISQYHLDVTGSLRQKVKPAVQLFSNTVSKAILYCSQKGWMTDPRCQAASSIIKLINDWFDLFNMQLKYEKNKGSAYGLDLSNQDAILHDMNEFITDVRFGTHKNLIECQKGILRNNKSLQNLLQYLKRTYSDNNFEIEYLLTYRLNQDIVENFFSYIRSMGATHDHPSALNFKHRIRLYILGKHSTDLFTCGMNTEGNDSEEKIVHMEDAIISRTIFNHIDDLNCSEEVTNPEEEHVEGLSESSVSNIKLHV